MSTETSTWSAFTDDELDFHLGMSRGMDYEEEWREDIAAEKERRTAERKAAEKAQRQREQEAFLKTPQGVLSSLKDELKEAEQKLAGMERPQRGPKIHPDEALDVHPLDAAYTAQAMAVQALRERVAEHEQRLPFRKVDDAALEVVLEAHETNFEEAKREYDALQEELRTTGRDPAATARGRRILAEYEAAKNAIQPVAAEREFRRRDRLNEAAAERMAYAQVMRTREEALGHWRNRVADLERELNAEVREGESQHYDLAPLREAREAVAKLEAAKANNTPPEKAELAQARERLAQSDQIKPIKPGAVELTRWS